MKHAKSKTKTKVKSKKTTSTPKKPQAILRHRLFVPTHLVTDETESLAYQGVTHMPSYLLTSEVRNSIIAKSRLSKLVFGIGICDTTTSCTDVKRHGRQAQSKAYSAWTLLLARCYDKTTLAKHPTYTDCFVCDEWLLFSNFEKWFTENHIPGCHLDKDILVKNNRVYGPSTCKYVPQFINNLLCTNHTDSTGNPQGVSVGKGNKYQVGLSRYGKRYSLGNFTSKDEAFITYCFAKYKHIKECAYWSFELGLIDEEVYARLNAIARECKTGSYFDNKKQIFEQHNFYSEFKKTQIHNIEDYIRQIKQDLEHCKQKTKNENATKAVIAGVTLYDDAPHTNARARKAWNSLFHTCQRTSTMHVCAEWHIYSKFLAWYEANYIHGNHMNLYIMMNESLEIGPSTCTYVPRNINNFMAKRSSKYEGILVGVQKLQNGKYSSQISIDGVRKTIGVYETEQLATSAYYTSKYKALTNMATDAYEKALIKKNVFKKLLSVAKELKNNV